MFEGSRFCGTINEGRSSIRCKGKLATCPKVTRVTLSGVRAVSEELISPLVRLQVRILSPLAFFERRDRYNLGGEGGSPSSNRRAESGASPSLP